MNKLDFSGINKIAYKGFEDAEARDTLLEAGYTIVEEPVPFTDQEPAPAEPAPPAQPQPSAFTDHTGSRDYKRLYRIAFDYHAQHNPPTVDKEYWRTHTPGLDDTPEAEAQYWIKAAEDIGKAAAQVDGDPLLTDLLIAAMNELEREYKAIREEAAAGNADKAS